MSTNYIDVTEFPDQEVPLEQVQRLNHRYMWASNYCKGKDVLEVACGSGYSLNFLKEHSRTLEAGDYSSDIVAIAKKLTNESINILQFDASSMPFPDNSKDVILIFEAIYYLEDLNAFLLECKRVLRDEGILLIVTANKDLYDFNPSPHSFTYFGVEELTQALNKPDWTTKIYGYLSTKKISLRQRLFRPIKKIANILGIIPKSMDGKAFLKKLVFGETMPLPKTLDQHLFEYQNPVNIVDNKNNKEFKVIYCASKLKKL